MTYYRTTVVDVGPEAGDMAAAGVVILFGEPLPEALAEMSVVHRPSQTLDGHAISVGDVISVGGAELRITAVGDLAAKNLEDLGHIVLYVDQPNQKLLPGAVLATGGLPPIERDAVIEFRTGS
jgi:glucitol/sorbitol PTS system EIIA component